MGSARGAGQQSDGTGDAGDYVADEHQHGGQHVVERPCGEAAIAAPRCAGGWRVSGFAQALRRGADQRGQVVRQDLGGHIDQESLPPEAGHGFEVPAVLEPLESLLNRKRPAKSP